MTFTKNYFSILFLLLPYFTFTLREVSLYVYYVVTQIPPAKLHRHAYRNNTEHASFGWTDSQSKVTVLNF